ncbi:MAG TPA: MacB family efflux pump subunit [Stellaceae bacterium]|nr:MacB family efflux pump subunit [Stellaceae bacterium]
MRHTRLVAPPLIELRDVGKTYDTGGGLAVEVLRGLSLTVRAGEFVAVMGASGSGKSTLMNLLGLLDKPSRGEYRLAGADVASLDRDELARLRRDTFGFVFQQYNLIPTATARENVEVPAIYAGLPPAERRKRAESLLAQLGLDGRFDNRPNQLSGGQQQRVSIARALMNGGRIILADEPTGALDSRSGAEVMALLKQLAAAGHTIILITHDRAIAEAADRIVEIADGRITHDTGTARSAVPPAPFVGETRRAVSPALSVGEALKAARRALSADLLRTALTLLGIIIGTAAVIALMAIGEGSRQTVLDQLAVFGTNRLYVNPGNESGRGPGGTLSARDADLVRDVPNVAAAMPYLQGQVTVRYGNVDARTTATAVTTDYPRILNWPLSEGVFFTREDERGLAAVAVIGRQVARTLFADGVDPIGRFILVNNVPFQVIGVLSEKGAVSGDADDDDTIAIPFETGSQRIFGTPNLSWISVLIDDLGKADRTSRDIAAVLAAKHHVQDFRIYNKAASIEARSRAQNSLTLLLGFTATISLFVGGIGVMNIMLMSVTERTREIGIRMATGARTRDILRQFLAEALMLSGAGGAAGLVLGHLAGLTATLVGTRVIFTLHAAIGAVLCGALTGLVFGFMPARRAARLEPVTALARE